jgi:peptidoglycan hydrolase-like protein with peptidoglycan-binding domain
MGVLPRLVILPIDGLPLGKRWLSLGDQGRDVRQLQEILTALYEAGVTGEYDLLTREGVKAFQRAYHLSVDGVTGPDTCRLLAEAKIHNRVLKKIKEEENLSFLADLYGVGRQAFKDPETRRRLERAKTGRLVMLEKRELIFSVPTQELVEGTVEKIRMGGPLYSARPEELKGLAEKPMEPGASLVVDLTGEKLTSGKKRMLRRFRSKTDAELIWRLRPDGYYYPTPEEADALLIPLSASVSEQYTHGVWLPEVKRVLTYYPCTRLLLHFDLRGKEKGEKGEERFITPAERRMTRLNRVGAPKRLGAYGWIFYRYRWKEEIRAVLFPDALTVRGILNHIDRLNLRGVVLSGLENWPEIWQEEGNRYFLATPRILVMKEEGLA